jgi:hypothetical protein
MSACAVAGSIARPRLASAITAKALRIFFMVLSSSAMDGHAL